MYDLIGDIHGHADALERLLAKLGYRETRGAWRHPSRRVIFLGDFIDRGPRQVDTVRIARAMVDADAALAVMGNHEYNAVGWTLPNPRAPGGYLRPHNPVNRSQHQGFLDAVGAGSPLHRELVAWFRTLPVYLERDGLRVVHACWHPASLQSLCENWLDEERRIRDDEAWVALGQKHTPPYEAIETVLKGLEIPLPSGYGFTDLDGNPRHRIRTRWWATHAPTYRDLAMVSPKVIESIPHTPVPEHVLPGYHGDEPPLFLGHYWLTGVPAPLAPNIACLDYSIAAKSGSTGGPGKLVAYRWDGEPVLSAQHYVWVE